MVQEAIKDTQTPQQALKAIKDKVKSMEQTEKEKQAQEKDKEMEHSNEVWDLLTNQHHLPRQQVARNMLHSFAGEDLRGELEKITIPTLLVHGSEDKICPAGASRYMSTKVKGAQMVIFPETGHAPFLTRADGFNQSLGRFLKAL